MAEERIEIDEICEDEMRHWARFPPEMVDELHAVSVGPCGVGLADAGVCENVRDFPDADGLDLLGLQAVQ